MSSISTARSTWISSSRSISPSAANTRAGTPYVFVSRPVSLGNAIRLDPSFQGLIDRRDFVGILLREGRLYFRKKGTHPGRPTLRVLADQVCDLAEQVERYTQSWMR